MGAIRKDRDKAEEFLEKHRPPKKQEVDEKQIFLQGLTKITLVTIGSVYRADALNMYYVEGIETIVIYAKNLDEAYSKYRSYCVIKGFKDYPNYEIKCAFQMVNKF